MSDISENKGLRSTSGEMETTEDDGWAVVSKKKEKVEKPKSKRNPKKNDDNRDYRSKSTSIKKKNNNQKQNNTQETKPYTNKSNTTIKKTSDKTSSKEIKSSNHDDGSEEITKSLTSLKLDEGESLVQKDDIPLEILGETTIRDFFEISRNFLMNSSEPDLQFISRGLINTGCACFRNCIIQALFSLKEFRRLLFTLISVSEQKPFEPDFHSTLPYWKEFLTLSIEFSTSRRNTSSFPDLTHTTVIGGGANSRKNKNGFNNVYSGLSVGFGEVSKEPVSAVLFMPLMCRAFQNAIEIMTGVVTYDPSLDSNYVDTSDNKKKKGSQQDAMEFLTFLLDKLHEEFIAAEKTLQLEPNFNASKFNGTKSSTTKSIGSNDASSSIEGSEEGDEDGWSKVTSKPKNKEKSVIDEKSKESTQSGLDSSVVSQLFHGSLRSEVVYKQKKVRSVTFQRFHCLTLDLVATEEKDEKRNGSMIKLTDCLESYFTEEVVDDGVKRLQRLSHSPQILLLQLGRFSFDRRTFTPLKVKKPVEYPLELVLNPSWLSETDSHREKITRYSLRSVVLHHGGKATGGHYSSYVMSDELEGVTDYGGWIHYNDAKVGRVSESQALSANEAVYILFYSKIEA